MNHCHCRRTKMDRMLREELVMSAKFRLTCKFGLVALVLLSLIPFRASAGEYDIVGNCSADFEMPKSRSIDPLFSIVGEPMLYIGAFDDTEMELSVSERIQMHTQLIPISEDNDRVEVVTRKKVLDGRRICAWISKEDVLDNEARPVQVGTPVEWTDPVTGEMKTLLNPLALKALLRSNPQYESDGATEVIIYDKPIITSNQRTSALVFGVYKIYAERETDSGHWYWIAGEDPHYPTKFAGWIPDHHVLLWESQLSLYFNDESDKAAIFATRNHAIVSDENAVIGTRPKNFKERSLGIEGEDTLDVNLPRFPILNEERSASNEGRAIYRIGFFGNDESIGTGEAENVNSSRRAKVQLSLKNIDILFLIDNTLSMTEYFNSVVQAVKNSTEEINRINDDNGYEIKVKFAAATYGDYLDQSANIDSMQFEIVSRLGRPGNTDHLDRLTAIAATPGSHYRDAIGDKPEAGMAGIIRGIEDLQWTADSLYKVVVWIGDHGSREVGNVENVSVADVRQVIIDNNVLLLPINVSGRYAPRWNSQFIRQGDQMSDDGRGLRTFLAHDGGPSDDYDTAQEYIEQAIYTLYKSTLLTHTALREQTDISQTIFERPELLDLGIPAAETDVKQISQSLCQMAFGSKGCDTIKEEGQFMTEGYVRYDDGDRNYDFWVNMPEDQLELLQRVLESTCKGFERNNVKKYVENAMTLAQNAMEGERYRSDIPIGEYLRRFFLLPRGHFPSFLESTPERIEEAWQEARDLDVENGDLARTSAIADPICRSSTMLDLVINQKRVADPDVDVVRTTSITGKDSYYWSVKDESQLIEFDWEWAQGGENNYIYLPVSYLPGSIPVN